MMKHSAGAENLLMTTPHFTERFAALPWLLAPGKLLTSERHSTAQGTLPVDSVFHKAIIASGPTEREK